MLVLNQYLIVASGWWPRGSKPTYYGVPARAPYRMFKSYYFWLTVRIDAFFFQPGTIVVNAGDLLARWSNDVLRSTLHRVVAPPAKKISDTESITPARQSIAFFCNPNAGTQISCLPNCGPDAKYSPVTTEQYIVGRLSATYN
jgi:isopenicillin N synthase-like dioxygenase